ncbi:hypothetical protein QL285_025923 [Trifolium repens]|nr:hypothetical protein QL285_025923 [Trifolium repens]
MEIDGLIKSLGYASVKCLWYCDPSLSFSRGLRPLNNDNDLLNFVGDVKGFEVVDVYVEHIVDNPLVVSESDVDDDENWVADSDFEAEIDWTTVLPKETFASEIETGPTEKLFCLCFRLF